MGKILLAFYGVMSVAYCISTLRRTHQELKSGLDWFFAIILPLACCLGVFGYVFDAGKTLAWIYLPILVLGISGAMWEMRDIRKLEGGLNVRNVILGLLMVSIMFGIGLFFGLLWLRTALSDDLAWLR